MAASLALALLGGCGHPDITRIGWDGRPFVPEADERLLWAEAEREESALARAVTPYADAAIEDYLTGVAVSLVPAPVRAAGAPAIRILVIADPALNAFAMPDGRLYIHTGVLARLDNEAQLATILGHELAHVTSRDALRWWRDGAHGSGVKANTFVALGLRVAAVAAVSGYGSIIERNADALVMEWMIAAGYDPREAPGAYERLADPRGDSTRIERFALGQRSWLEERIASLRGRLRDRHASLDITGRARHAEGWATRIQPLLRDNARLEIRAGRFGLARDQLERAATLAPRDPLVPLYMGDLYRLRAQRATAIEDRSALLTRARLAYERAAALDPAHADPYWGLGLLHFQTGDHAQARAAFERYLALAPDARDARRVREYVTELAR